MVVVSVLFMSLLVYVCGDVVVVDVGVGVGMLIDGAVGGVAVCGVDGVVLRCRCVCCW